MPGCETFGLKAPEYETFWLKALEYETFWLKVLAYGTFVSSGVPPEAISGHILGQGPNMLKMGLLRPLLATSAAKA